MRALRGTVLSRFRAKRERKPGERAITHETSSDGYHRLAYTTSRGRRVEGEWAAYHEPATLAGYIAFTEHWGGQRRVLELREIPYFVPVLHVPHSQIVRVHGRVTVTP
jgi:hypothetical protein